MLVTHNGCVKYHDIYARVFDIKGSLRHLYKLVVILHAMTS